MEVKPGYKQTEVGVIPEDWEVVNIDDVCDVKSGKRLPKGHSLTAINNGFPYIRVSDMSNGSVDLDDIHYVPLYIAPKIKQYRIYTEDIFISVAGTLGIIGRIPIELNGANLTENADRLTQISCDIDYLYHVLNSKRIQSIIDEQKTTGAQPKLALTRIRKFLIPIPKTREEQRLLSAALSDINSLITSLEKLIEKKKNIKQGVMQELLTGKRRLPGFTGEWEKTSLGKLVSMRVVSLGRGAVISKISVNACKGDYPIYSSSILNNGLFGYWGNYMFDEEMITWSVDGGGDFFHRKKHRYSVTNVCGYMRVDQSKICYGFLYYQLSLAHSSLVFDYTIKAHPSVVKKLYSVWMPPIHEQIAIYGALNDIDDDINTLIIKLAKYKQIKKGMMQELLTGRIRLL